MASKIPNDGDLPQSQLGKFGPKPDFIVLQERTRREPQPLPALWNILGSRYFKDMLQQDLKRVFEEKNKGSPRLAKARERLLDLHQNRSICWLARQVRDGLAWNRMQWTSNLLTLPPGWPGGPNTSKDSENWTNAFWDFLDDKAIMAFLDEKFSWCWEEHGHHKIDFCHWLWLALAKARGELEQAQWIGYPPEVGEQWETNDMFMSQWHIASFLERCRLVQRSRYEHFKMSYEEFVDWLKERLVELAVESSDRLDML